jgi:hypothetical protein
MLRRYALSALTFLVFAMAAFFLFSPDLGTMELRAYRAYCLKAAGISIAGLSLYVAGTAALAREMKPGYLLTLLPLVGFAATGYLTFKHNVTLREEIQDLRRQEVERILERHAKEEWSERRQ